ncbi:MAG: DUF433 domain-containing protein [Anaerolineae bacterium]
MLDRITIDPEIFHGQPCIRGMRMPVYVVLDLLASGLSIAEILDEYPYLEEEDIWQCIKYASWLAREQTIELVREVASS